MITDKPVNHAEPHAVEFLMAPASHPVPSLPDHLSHPTGLALWEERDDQNTYFYLSFEEKNCIYRFKMDRCGHGPNTVPCAVKDGSVIGECSKFGHVDGAQDHAKFHGPHGLTVDRHTHDLIIADSENHRVCHFLQLASAMLKLFAFVSISHSEFI